MFSMDFLIANYNYAVVVILMTLGLWAMIAKKNRFRKCSGMAIFQTGIILFYISMAAKKGSTIPIIEHGHDVAHHAVNAAHYANPLTQILMTTAMVAGAGTLGVALAVIQRVYLEYGPLHEDEILEKIN